jgi:hypothetical protein
VDWVLERGSVQASGIVLLACVEWRGSLYVLVGGLPATAEPQDLARVKVSLPDGDSLCWRGGSGCGDRKDSVNISRFDLPPAEATCLDVRFDVGGATMFDIRLVRRA